MDRKEIYEKLEVIFKDVFDVEELELADETTADDIDEWDSLSHIQLIVAIEKEFGVKFTSAEILSWSNIGEFVDGISSKLQ